MLVEQHEGERVCSCSASMSLGEPRRAEGKPLAGGAVGNSCDSLVS